MLAVPEETGRRDRQPDRQNGADDPGQPLHNSATSPVRIPIARASTLRAVSSRIMIPARLGRESHEGGEAAGHPVVEGVPGPAPEVLLEPVHRMVALGAVLEQHLARRCRAGRRAVGRSGHIGGHVGGGRAIALSPAGALPFIAHAAWTAPSPPARGGALAQVLRRDRGVGAVHAQRLEDPRGQQRGVVGAGRAGEQLRPCSATSEVRVRIACRGPRGCCRVRRRSPAPHRAPHRGPCEEATRHEGAPRGPRGRGAAPPRCAWRARRGATCAASLPSACSPSTSAAVVSRRHLAALDRLGPAPRRKVFETEPISELRGSDPPRSRRSAGGPSPSRAATATRRWPFRCGARAAVSWWSPMGFPGSAGRVLVTAAMPSRATAAGTPA